MLGEEPHGVNLAFLDSIVERSAYTEVDLALKVRWVLGMLKSINVSTETEQVREHRYHLSVIAINGGVEDVRIIDLCSMFDD